MSNRIAARDEPHQTCTGTKNTSCELQSAPNLHKDEKNKSCELQSAPNLHRGKKNFRGILAPSQVDWKVFFVPVQVWCTLKFKTFVFCPCAGLVHFEVHNLCFFCPCAGLVHFEVHNLCFFCPCACLVHFEVENPMQLLISIVCKCS